GAGRRLELPEKITLHGYLAGRLILGIDEDWSPGPGEAFKAGVLAAFDPRSGRAEAIFQPSPTQTIDAVSVTASRVLVSLLDNVTGAMDVYTPGPGGGWTSRRLPFPKRSSLSIAAADHASDQAFVASESFLEPTTLWAVDAARGAAVPVKRLPPRFDAANLIVEQRFATSADGTRVPYFLVRPKA